MPDARNKHVPPSLKETAFNCPHCGAYAQQHWHAIQGSPLRNNATPQFVTSRDAANAASKINVDSDTQARLQAARLRRLATGIPFLDSAEHRQVRAVRNLSLSHCHNCRNVAVWRYDHLVWPTNVGVDDANSDLSEEVRDVYNEAALIVDASPRGAAALLRLGIQLLCKQVGESGENVNNDIGALVRKGLDDRVRKALDVVRVVGNHSVHPGQIDMADDRETALQLFGLVNLIADVMITQPKRVDAMYAALPESDRRAIERRDQEE